MFFRLGRAAFGPRCASMQRMTVPAPRWTSARFLSTEELNRAREAQHKFRAEAVRKRNQSVAMYAASAVRRLAT